MNLLDRMSCLKIKNKKIFDMMLNIFSPRNMNKNSRPDKIEKI